MFVYIERGTLIRYDQRSSFILEVILLQLSLHLKLSVLLPLHLNADISYVFIC